MREGTVPDAAGDAAARERRRPLLGKLRSRLGDGGPTERAARAPAGGEGVATPLSARREPRHVRAVPTNVEHKVASAVEVFNSSQCARTVAGVARSLGAPSVSVLPSESSSSVVRVVAAWELCWYRFEVDLADEPPDVRVAAQGAEVEELGEAERVANATADADGLLALR